MHEEQIREWLEKDRLAHLLDEMSGRMYSLAHAQADVPMATLMRNFAGELGTVALALKAVTEYAKQKEAEALRVKTIAVRELHKEYLERTPLGTQLAYIHDNEVVVLGFPKEGDDHNCDQMGCGSLDHVVRRVPLATP